MNELLKNAHLSYTRVELKYNGILIMSAVKFIRGGLFHTSMGEVELDARFTTVIAEDGKRRYEYIVSPCLTDVRLMSLALRENKVAIEDIGTFVELNRNDDNINQYIESLVSYKFKDIITTTDKAILI